MGINTLRRHCDSSFTATLACVVLALSFAGACGSSTKSGDKSNAMSAAGAPATAAPGPSGAQPAAPGGNTAMSPAGTAGTSSVVGVAGTQGGGGSAGNATAGTAGSVAGDGGSNAGSDANAAGDSGGEAGSAGSDGMATDTGTLPAITDPTEPGAFTPKWESNVGPSSSYTTIAPSELGMDELKHPILIWGPGAGATPEIYKSLLDHIASHGFVIVAYNTTPQGPELNAGIDWIIAESMRDGSPFFGKVDTTKIAMGGQSAGSLATFAAAKDERLTTTVHINGGTFDGNVMNLIRPAFYLCGDDPSVTGGDGTWESDAARPNCDRDFTSTTVPVWYGIAIGSSHTTVIDNPLAEMPSATSDIKKAYLGSTVAWLRWQLAGDQQMKALFVGPSCGYCTQKDKWFVRQKGLN